jgi:hypothetical protein
MRSAATLGKKSGISPWRWQYSLRACIVTFRTTLQDVEALLPIVVRIGSEVDKKLRSASLA